MKLQFLLLVVLLVVELKLSLASCNNCNDCDDCCSSSCTTTTCCKSCSNKKCDRENEKQKEVIKETQVVPYPVPMDGGSSAPASVNITNHVPVTSSLTNTNEIHVPINITNLITNNFNLTHMQTSSCAKACHNAEDKEKCEEKCKEEVITLRPIVPTCFQQCTYDFADSEAQSICIRERCLKKDDPKPETCQQKCVRLHPDPASLLQCIKEDCEHKPRPSTCFSKCTQEFEDEVSQANCVKEKCIKEKILDCRQECLKSFPGDVNQFFSCIQEKCDRRPKPKTCFSQCVEDFEELNAQQNCIRSKCLPPEPPKPKTCVERCVLNYPDNLNYLKQCLRECSPQTTTQSVPLPCPQPNCNYQVDNCSNNCNYYTQPFFRTACLRSCQQQITNCGYQQCQQQQIAPYQQPCHQGCDIPLPYFKK